MFQLLPLYTPSSRVLILGGGDGALLREVLERTEAGSVHMVELDGEVMRACAQHMPAVCGSYLDQGRGERFQVQEGDAFEFLDRMKVRMGL